MATQRELWLTVYAHEWYWCNISQRLDDRKLEYPSRYYMPLLHEFYARYKDEMPSFPMFEGWFEALCNLGRPIDCWKKANGRYPAPYFGAKSTRMSRVNSFLQEKDDERKVRRRRRWSLPYGGKWRKEWEPDAETWQRKKEEREKKKEWRDQLRKDQSWRKPRYQRGPGRWYKKARSAEHRAWVKQQLQRQNWDAFHPKEREVFEDPWMWSW